MASLARVAPIIGVAVGAAASSASQNSVMVANRSPGDLASRALQRALDCRAERWAGARGRDGGSMAWRAMVARAPVPANGGWPASISYSTQARLYWSLRPSRSALGAGLLRAHVGRSAHGEAAVGDVDVVAAGGRHGRGHAEVGHDRLAFLQQDVLRLDVAMDDVMPVGVAERSAPRLG